MNAEELKEFNRQNRTWLLSVWIYAIICLIILPIGFFIISGYFVQDSVFVSRTVSSAKSFPTYLIWQGTIAGGLGGVVNIFYSLIEVVLRGRRDREYLNIIYYLAQPFIGIIFGIVASLSLVTVVQLFGSTQQSRNIFFLVIFLSFIIGYQQRTILRVFNRKIL